jgi:hypothetical protein
MARYLGVMLLLYAIHAIAGMYISMPFIRIAIGAILFALYFFYIFKQEKNELRSFPVIGKYIR